jgi:hypothetical protein
VNVIQVHSPPSFLLSSLSFDLVRPVVQCPTRWHLLFVSLPGEKGTEKDEESKEQVGAVLLHAVAVDEAQIQTSTLYYIEGPLPFNSTSTSPKAWHLALGWVAHHYIVPFGHITSQHSTGLLWAASRYANTGKGQLR